MNEKRKGFWIPKEILNLKSIDNTNKMLLSEIYSLSMLENGCTAGREFFAELLNLKSPSSVTKRIHWLEKMGAIKTQNIYIGKKCVGSKISRGTLEGLIKLDCNQNIVPNTKELEQEILVGDSLENDSVVQIEVDNDSSKNETIVPTGNTIGSQENTINSSINSTINSSLLIQEPVQVNNTKIEISQAVKKDTGHGGMTTGEFARMQMQKLETKLSEMTHLGNNIMEFASWGKIERLSYELSNDKFRAVKPLLQEYLDIRKSLKGY